MNNVGCRMQYLVGNRPALTKSTKKICRSLNLDSLIQVEPHRWMLNAHLIEITKLASAGSPLLHTRLPTYKKRIETFASRKSIDAGWMNQIPELYVTEFASPGTWLEMANGWPDEGREVTHWPREIQSSGASNSNKVNQYLGEGEVQSWMKRLSSAKTPIQTNQ